MESRSSYPVNCRNFRGTWLCSVSHGFLNRFLDPRNERRPRTLRFMFIAKPSYNTASLPWLPGSMSGSVSQAPEGGTLPFHV